MPLQAGLGSKQKAKACQETEPACWDFPQLTLQLDQLTATIGRLIGNAPPTHRAGTVTIVRSEKLTGSTKLTWMVTMEMRIDMAGIPYQRYS